MRVLPVFTGSFGEAEAERLLWRAGFGPRGAEAQILAEKGFNGAINYLVNPPSVDTLVGQAPVVDGAPLAPYDAYGHDHLWWLDKMVRTSRPLVERMTLIWHDWFATSNETVGNQRLMLAQNAMFRQVGLGSFKGLALRVTIDPAMLIFLDGLNSIKGSPNENYGRELMECFTLGSGNGYTQTDVREQARALTGWTANWKNNTGWVDVHFDGAEHDSFEKYIFHQVGEFGWKDSVRLSVEHPLHPPYFVNRLWSYFIPVPPDPTTATLLEQLYVSSGFQIRPVVGAILRHPLLYEGPRMIKSPVTYTAGLLRQRDMRVESGNWVNLDAAAGQQLFYPPNVMGWVQDSWLNTSTFQARWMIARQALQNDALNPDDTPSHERPPSDPSALVDWALGWWGNPSVSTQTRGALLSYAQTTMAAAIADPDRMKTFPIMTYNALIATWQRVLSPRRGALKRHEESELPPLRRVHARGRAAAGCRRGRSWASLDRAWHAEPGRHRPPIAKGRAFLSRSLGAMLTVYGAGALGPRAFDDAIARAAGGGAPGTTLVSVFAPGGWDALSLLYPTGDPNYRALRPELALAPEAGPVFESDNRLHWNPALEPFAKLHGQRKLTVFPAIGYTDPNMSHFTSRHYWEVGALDAQLGTSRWLGRIPGRGRRRLEDPLQGLSLDATLLPSLATAKVPVATLENPTSYYFDSQNVWDVPGVLLQDAIGSLGGLSVPTDPFLTQASQVAAQSDQLRRKLSRFIGPDGQANFHTKVKYPDNGSFSTSLAGLAALLHAGFPIRAAALQAPGEFDTHSQEAGALTQGLQETAQVLAAFQEDIEQRNLGQRVITLVWSEFGRRAAQNDTNGTDHGAAGAAFLLGERVKHRMVGEFPGLGRGLDANGNVRETVDFRSVYKSLAEEWFGVDGNSILPDGQTMPSLSLLK